MEIDGRCWVEIISTQHQAVILRIEKSLIRPLQRLWFRYTLVYEFYLLTLKNHNPIQHLSTAGSNPSLRTRGHVGCWMEFHRASLSEGWCVVHWSLVTDGFPHEWSTLVVLLLLSWTCCWKTICVIGDLKRLDANCHYMETLSSLLVQCVTPQTVMLGGIPPSYTLVYEFYLLTLKNHNPIQHLSTAGSNPSLRTRGHVGCWMEFHRASLSEGWHIGPVTRKVFPCNDIIMVTVMVCDKYYDDFYC